MFNQSNVSWHQYPSIQQRPQMSDFSVGYQRFSASPANFTYDLSSSQSVPQRYHHSTLGVNQSSMNLSRPVFDPRSHYILPSAYPVLSNPSAVQPGLSCLSSGAAATRVKKPLNAFMIFMKEARREVVDEFGPIGMASIHQILGRKWQSMDPSEQLRYYEMAKKEKDEHKRLYPSWSAKENYSANKKKRKTKVEEMNARKCRAVYGDGQSHRWCKSCRRKQRCMVNWDENHPNVTSFHLPTSTPAWSCTMNDGLNERRSRVALREMNCPSNVNRPGISLRNVVAMSNCFSSNSVQSGCPTSVFALSTQGRPHYLGVSQPVDRWYSSPHFVGGGAAEMPEYLRYENVNQRATEYIPYEDSNCSMISDANRQPSEFNPVFQNLNHSYQPFSYPTNRTPLNDLPNSSPNNRCIQESPNSALFQSELGNQSDYSTSSMDFLPRTNQSLSFRPANQEEASNGLPGQYMTPDPSNQDLSCQSRCSQPSEMSCESEAESDLVEVSTFPGLSIEDDFDVNFKLFLGRCLLFCLLLVVLTMIRVTSCALILLR